MIQEIKEGHEPIIIGHRCSKAGDQPGFCSPHLKCALGPSSASTPTPPSSSTPLARFRISQQRIPTLVSEGLESSKYRLGVGSRSEIAGSAGRRLSCDGKLRYNTCIHDDPFYRHPFWQQLRRFESCWPAIMKGVDGVILVYNPEIPTHDIEVGIW